ncbi:carbohydrate ABC transporter permease, partial [Kitasatospora cineracea]
MAPPARDVRVRGRGEAAVALHLEVAEPGGLAIPAQAVIVPMFYVISKAGLYDH